ncbi:MAG: hypothetical protein P1U89_18205 [Verrucomicrobiales bacterium]|nr:hypothetical protein [Verrucomicrobiales bacterium]
MTVKFLEFVEADLREGRLFYDEQEPGVGDYFVDSLIADAESLSLYGGVHKKTFGYHRMLARVFPFAIYYLTDNDTVEVYAILDMRSKPSWIRDELGGRSSRDG